MCRPLAIAALLVHVAISASWQNDQASTLAGDVVNVDDTEDSGTDGRDYALTEISMRHSGQDEQSLRFEHKLDVSNSMHVTAHHQTQLGTSNAQYCGLGSAHVKVDTTELPNISSDTSPDTNDTCSDSSDTLDSRADRETSCQSHDGNDFAPGNPSNDANDTSSSDTHMVLAKANMLSTQRACSTLSCSDQGSDCSDDLEESVTPMEVGTFHYTEPNIKLVYGGSVQHNMHCMLLLLLDALMSTSGANVDCIQSRDLWRLIVRSNGAVRRHISYEMIARYASVYLMFHLVAFVTALIIVAAWEMPILWEYLTPDVFFNMCMALLVPQLFPCYLMFAAAIDDDDALAMQGAAESAGLTDLERAIVLMGRADGGGITDATQVCPICLRRLQKSARALCRVACGHVFHGVCLRGWVRRPEGTHCPVCRTALVSRFASTAE